MDTWVTQTPGRPLHFKVYADERDIIPGGYALHTPLFIASHAGLMFERWREMRQLLRSEADWKLYKHPAILWVRSQPSNTAIIRRFLGPYHRHIQQVAGYCITFKNAKLAAAFKLMFVTGESIQLDLAA